MKRHVLWNPGVFLLLLLPVLSAWRAPDAPLRAEDKGAGEWDTTRTKVLSWFTVRVLAENVWRIDDHGGDNMYLVAGDQRALLIDAGTGVADLAACVRSITALPLLVVNTHGHPDHCGGDYQFAEVYAHPSDFQMIGSFCTPEFHENEVRDAGKRDPECAALLLQDLSSFTMPTLLPAREGATFDLGNRIITVIEVPGHTRGSICLMDEAHGLLFAGDNDNELVWLFLNDCLPLEDYLLSLQHLGRRAGRDAILFPGHGEPLDGAFIGEQIACAQSILSGECPGEPYKTFVDFARVCTYKRARIAFNPYNLHKDQK
jgi:hydroxyacylglutathione hydrolase